MSGPWIAAFIVLACVVVLLAIVVLGLVARVERLAARGHRQVSVDPQRELAGSGAQVGESVSMVEFDSDGQRQPVDFANAVLVFGTAGCRRCDALRAELVSRPLVDTRRDQVLVWDGDGDGPPGWRTVGDHARVLRTLLRVDATPYCLVTDSDSVVLAAGIASTVSDLRRLLADADGSSRSGVIPPEGRRT